MHQVFINFQKQFTYNPTIANRQKYAVAKKFIILGMGGSHLAADLIKNYNPQIDLLIHKNYGLPKLADKELKQSLIIANSYSGNTEEVLDGLKIAIKKKLNIIVIATGGKLISLAKKNNLPYIQMPNWGIQPRCALGLNCRAILKALGQNQAYAEIGTLAKTLKGRNYKSRGKTIAKMLKKIAPTKVILTTTYSKNFLVEPPGLMPGTNAPLFFSSPEISSALKKIRAEKKVKLKTNKK